MNLGCQDRLKIGAESIPKATSKPNVWKHDSVDTCTEKHRFLRLEGLRIDEQPIKNSGKYGTGVDIQSLSVLDGFWIDLGSVLRPSWQPEGINRQWKIRPKFKEAGVGFQRPLEALERLWRSQIARTIQNNSGR